MITTLQKWGNSQGLRIPKSFVEQLGLHDNDKLEVSIEQELIVIRRAAKRRMSFEERMEGYTGQYTLSEWDTGTSVGNEYF